MSAEPPVSVRVARRFAASAERVFDAWLDPERARTFLFATATGRMVRAEIDARVGGRFCFVDRRDGEDVEDVEHWGEYLEIDRPRRLVFTFMVPNYSSELSRVIIEITPDGSGCELTLTSERVPHEYASRTESGWALILAGLAATLGQ